MSIPRRLGRLAQGFVSSLQEDERFREGSGRGASVARALRGAFEAAWKGASEEWRKAEERRAAQEAAAEQTWGWRSATTTFTPRKYPPNVLAAYDRLGLVPSASHGRSRQETQRAGQALPSGSFLRPGEATPCRTRNGRDQRRPRRHRAVWGRLAFPKPRISLVSTPACGCSASSQSASYC